ncbi:MAG: glutamyl-tRNA reductase [bacterium]
MEIIVVGANHKTMPIELREKLAIPQTKLIEALKSLNQSIKERVILSTCNRIEVYAATTYVKEAKIKIINFLHQYYQANLENYLYVHQDKEAIRHLFDVAASLDSMIIGEPQILGQVKESYEQAFKINVTDTYLDNLFQKAILVGKQVRNQTAIGKGAVSVSFAAIELAKKIFGKLDGKRVLIIGAGKISEDTAKHLFANKVSTILATNRTYEKAKEIADKFSGQAIKFDDLIQTLPEMDIVISSTSAPHLIIKKEDIKNLMSLRKHKPIFFIDIAVPRDIDPGIGSFDGIYLYNIDDLQTVVQSNIKSRQKEIKKCQMIIEKETEKFCHWLNFRQLSPIISSLQQKMESIREEELNKTFLKEKNLTQKEKERLKLITAKLTERFLKEPIIALKKYASSDDPTYGKILTDLFNLNNDGR